MTFTITVAKLSGVPSTRQIKKEVSLGDQKDWDKAGERLNEWLAQGNEPDPNVTYLTETSSETRVKNQVIDIKEVETQIVVQAAARPSLFDRIANILKPGGQKIGTPGTSEAIRFVQSQQPEAAAAALFQRLVDEAGVTPKAVQIRGSTLQIAELPGVGVVKLRPAALSESGLPTVDVSIRYLGIDKVKFTP
jgi:hypothetical protein